MTVTPPGSNSPDFLTSGPGVNKAGGGEHGPENPSTWRVPPAGPGQPGSGGDHAPEMPSNWTSPSAGGGEGPSGGTHAPNAPFKNPGLGQ